MDPWRYARCMGNAIQHPHNGVKVLVGVDLSGSYRPVLDFLLRLQFNGLEVHLLHCVEAIIPDGFVPGQVPTSGLSEIYEELRRDGAVELDQAAAVLEAHGVSVTKVQSFGNTGSELVDYAKGHDIDLIAVFSRTRGAWESFFFGSVAKALVQAAPCNVLVLKNESGGSSEVVAVLATDHSPYMDQCLAEFKRLRPHLGSLTVVCAEDRLPILAGSEEKALVEYRQKTESLAEDLSALVPSTQGRYVDDNLPGAIRAVMAESHAELLLMGAQGHGFLDRIMLGSQSFAQVVVEPHNVLVLRPKG